ncbi:polysaccharide pyruvyl transferase family protein [Glutamicibacter sp. FBE19]|uniref:polysaccharide pyruvyl transferase family protein n=1 Tax=Glutamicibacter sp. FBE19 TaxID=2761534 RepID=UPI00189661DA|nr:polysaccharide pyruvyl transferase family protein [Glutamicibacter sp. FBE19]MBF6671408.1 polysaccharide pyruvyl transferase family protein [Glutamicibacter sp. FBE19]
MELNIAKLNELLNESSYLTQCCDKIFVYRNIKCVIEFPVLMGQVALDIEVNENSFAVSLVGRTIATRRLIRNAFLTKYHLRQEDGERLLIPRILENGSDEAVVGSVIDLIEEIQKETTEYLSFKRENIAGDEPGLPIYWWDGLANFGDSVGPLLVSEILGVKPMNARQRVRAGNTLYSVGSITTSIDRDNVTVWGSGLLAPLSDRQIMNLRRRENVNVLAVRGRYTQLELEAKLGWSVPSVFGDPALLLPKYFPVARRDSAEPKSVSVVLHWEHAKYLDTEDENINFINVGDDARLVVEQIASSSVCISSSLHGIIVAQAYGIPWIWLQVSDHKLHSSNFKFDDFFSTLNRRQVCKKSVLQKDLNEVSWHELAESATLPDLIIDLGPLEESLLTAGLSDSK